MTQYVDFLLPVLSGHMDALMRVLLILVLTGVVLNLTQRILPRLRDFLAAQQSNQEDSRRILTLSRVVRYSLNVVIVAVAGLLILGEFGIAVAPILGAAGVLGIAVGFGAQSLVKDYFTGFFLLLENQIRHGDVVEAGGKAGLVEEFTLRYLRLRDYGGNVHYIPNGAISVVTNMSLGFAQAVIDVSVAYPEDLNRVFDVMRAVGKEMREDAVFLGKILDDLEIAGVEAWADSSIILRCRFRVAPLMQWDVKREYLRRLKYAFDKQGIEIPYPHLTIVPEKEIPPDGIPGN